MTLRILENHLTLYNPEGKQMIKFQLEVSDLLQGVEVS